MASRRLCKDQESVAHGCGAEPLLAEEAMLAIRPGGLCARGVGTDIGAAVPFGHRHAEEHALLAGIRPEPWGVRDGRQQRLPLRRSSDSWSGASDSKRL